MSVLPVLLPIVPAGFIVPLLPNVCVPQRCFSVYKGVDPGIYFCQRHYLSSCTLMCV